MVYAPADGLVTDQTPIWETQVHKVWEEPVVSSIVLTPASDVNPTGQDHQVTATVRDQFGAPMAGVNLYFFGTPTEGGAPYDAAPYFGVPQAWTSNPVVTDANGVASVTGQAVAWSNWNIWAQANLNGDIGSPADTANMAGAVKSNVVTKYWAQEVALTLDADPGAFLTVPAGISTAVNGTGPGLGNRTFNIYKDTPTGVVIGTGVYDNTNGNVVASDPGNTWHDHRVHPIHG